MDTHSKEEAVSQRRTYYHSVTLNKERCMGCTNCLKRCPTEAIRVWDGKAKIIKERCIDCGECIRICPHHAKEAATDPLEMIHQFKYKIALPAPTLYGQFKNLASIDSVLSGLLEIGFDDVYEVARGADLVSYEISKRLQDPLVPRPVISSACPAIVRLIRDRFPELVDNIVDVHAPVEVAARVAKRNFARDHQVPEAEIGAFFITPCAAKMTAIRNPIGAEKSAVDGAISILEVYGQLSSYLKHPNLQPLHHASAYGVGWANSGGESAASGCENYLAVDGIENVIRVLDEIENNKLNGLAFFEGLACVGGCVSGPLVFENGFVAKDRIRKLVEKLPQKRPDPAQMEQELQDIEVGYSQPIAAQDVMMLDQDMGEAIRKMEQMEMIEKRLPGLDCGSCGAPTCRALAEDIVRGFAVEMDCIFKLKERIQQLAQDMVDVSNVHLGSHAKKEDPS